MENSIILEVLNLVHAEELLKLHIQNRKFLEPWEPKRSNEFYTLKGQQEAITRSVAAYQAETDIPFVILKDQKIVGTMNISGIVKGVFESCNIGYWVSEEHLGQGIASKAVKLVKCIVFKELKLHRIQAGTLPNNLASQKVLIKNGFSRYGYAPNYLKINGKWQDHILFQLINEK
ncbi:MAG: GNAT family N-acetyltransferase [Micrococcaceae bacterium]